jgi:hypothetical protein
MSDDLTPKTPDADSDLLTLILTIVKKLDKHETILVHIADRLGKMESRIDALEQRLIAVETRLDAVETRLGIVDSRLDVIEVRLGGFEQTFKRSVHNLDRSQMVLNDAIRKINIGFLDVNERLQRLELPNKPTNSQT